MQINDKNLHANAAETRDGNVRNTTKVILVCFSWINYKMRTNDLDTV